MGPSFCLARSRIRWYFFMERKRGLPPLKEPEKRQRLSPTGQDSPSSLTLPPFRQLKNAWNPSQGMVWLPPLGKRFEEPPDHTEDNHTFPLPSIRGASKPVIEHSIPSHHVDPESLPSTPPSTESSPDTSPAQPSRKQKGKKEGLEETTVRVVQLLQARGTMLFKDINQTLDIPYRRSSDILNVLVTTPLLCKEGKKRENKYPYVFGDGNTIVGGDSVNICHIMEDIDKERHQIAQLQERIKQLQAIQESK